MKKTLLKLFLLIGFFCWTAMSYGQFVTETVCTTTTVMPADGDIFTDPTDGVTGGPGGDCTTTSSGDPGDYPNANCVTVTTLSAPVGTQISVTFTSFRVNGNFDWLSIFDGASMVTATNGGGTGTNPSSPDPELWRSTADGDELIDMTNAGMTTFTSTNGSLTFAFRTSSVVQTCGWEATVSIIGPPPPMTEPIYFTSREGDIFMANRDGSGIPSTIYTGATAEPIGLEIDPMNGDLYYAGGNTSDIFEAPLDGSGPISAIPSLSSGNEHHEFEIDYDNGLVYYTSDNGGLWVGNLDGTGTSTNLVSTVNVNSGVTLDRTNGVVYFNSDQSNIGRVNIDGTGLNDAFIPTNGNSRGVTLDEENGFIFWVERGSNLVRRANTDGTGTITLYPAGDAPYGIDYDPEEEILYWTTFASFATPGSVWAAPADGSGTPTMLFSGISGLRGIAAGRNMRRLEAAGSPPILNCPGDVTLNASPGACDAPFGFATPPAVDPDGGSVTVTQTMGPASPGPFPVGDTVVEFTATNDEAPNEVTTCQFVVTVVDNQAPTITCPADITQTNDPTLCGADITVPAPTIMDNCPVVAGMPIPVAESPVTDFLGGGALIDTPTVVSGTQMSAGGDVTLTAFFTGDFSFTGEVFALNGPDGSAVLSDNTSTSDCPATPNVATATIAEATWNGWVTTFGPDLTFTLLANSSVNPGLCADNNYRLSVEQGDATNVGPTLSNDYNGTNDASDFYPVGTTTVTWTYTDGGGNTASCSMDITVTDDEAPEIVCIGGPAPATGSDSASPGLNINSATPVVSSTITVTDDFSVEDLNVDVDVSHAWVGDLIIAITSPAGTTVTIMDQPGTPPGTFGCSGDDILATLDDEATDPIEDECDPGVPTINGTFTPNNPLSAFDGESTMGDWTLTITDTFPAGDDGVFNSWGITYEYLAPSSPPLEVFLDVDGMAFVPANQFVSMVSDNCGIAFYEVVDGVTVPPVDECGDNLGAPISSTLPPTESVAAVTESGVIGVDYTFDNVNIDISHTWTGDLDIELISPAGTTLLLSGGNGSSGDNYTGTVFMDGAPNITTGAPPFTGTFEPEGGTFASTFDGEEVNGDWTLRVTDNVGGDDGTLNDFCLDMIPVNPSQALFTCEDVGLTTVDIIVTDTGGNTATCTASVTVIDNIDPMLVCQDFTLELGPDGTAMLDPMDLINMDLTVEACGIEVSGVSMDDFSCDDIGTPQTVTLFVSDPSGNLASCEATVTVVDLLAPEVTCPADMTVDPGANNQLYEMPDYFGEGLASATDNCTDPVTIFAQDPAAGSFIGDGVYTVTLSATDEYGNVGTCTFELTVESILGVDESALDIGLSLYPNPAQDQVILSNATNILLEKATMFDVNGKMVQTIDLSGMQQEKAIDIAKLASGVYIVQIEAENASVVKRLIKE